MALKLITAATGLAVTLTEAKEHLEYTDTDRDTYITALIHGATAAAEQAMRGRAVMPQTWELALDAFPEAFKLTRLPVASVTSLTYADADGVVQTLAGAAYSLDIADDYGGAFVVPAYGTSWPSSRCEVNAVKLRYVAGYANAAAVPELIKAWIKLQVGAMFANRSAEGTAQTYALGYADRLLDAHVIWDGAL
jgi:uncharacterized phiE125 gp8 family phage protein